MFSFKCLFYGKKATQFIIIYKNKNMNETKTWSRNLVFCWKHKHLIYKELIVFKINSKQLIHFIWRKYHKTNSDKTMEFMNLFFLFTSSVSRHIVVILSIVLDVWSVHVESGIILIIHLHANLNMLTRAQ